MDPNSWTASEGLHLGTVLLTHSTVNVIGLPVVRSVAEHTAIHRPWSWPYSVLHLLVHRGHARVLCIGQESVQILQMRHPIARGTLTGHLSTGWKRKQSHLLILRPSFVFYFQGVSLFSVIPEGVPDQRKLQRKARHCVQPSPAKD